MKKLVHFLLLFCPTVLFGQIFDNTWMLGYNNDTILSNLRGISILTFPNARLKIEQNTALFRFNFNGTNTSFSDSSGNVLCYTNGVHIGNAAWEIMENGDYMTNAAEVQGEVYPQWFLALPFPGHPQKQLYFYENEGYSTVLSFHATKLLYCLIDLSLEKGLGKVIDRDSILIQDTLAVGKISAIKHANGRDWWVLVNEKNSNRFYRILVDPFGIHLLDSQTIGERVVDGVGQAGFSPNGEHYFIYGTVSSTVGAYINLYNFDRCSGLFSNHLHYHFDSNGWGGGSFSPNSKYLYINYFTQSYQYDLEALDVLASRVKVAEYDGFLDPFNTTFFLMQLAPDGKIYSSCPGGLKSMHIIHNPDEPGLACYYEQHGVALPTYNALSIPTFPNYRLGPLDGSSCDTLGIDNLPIAWWRSEQDTLEPLFIYFHDLSYYEPATWSWDFGDGSPSSSERHPQHNFPVPGNYKVCLTVSNANGSNTLCRTLYFNASSAQNPDIVERISVSPNPFRERLGVALSATLPNPVIKLYDHLGRLVRVEHLSFGITEIETGAFPPGMYFWEVTAAGEPIKSGKLMKME
jgi:hypothetical protein